jgi:hypothetical protein
MNMKPKTIVLSVIMALSQCLCSISFAQKKTGNADNSSDNKPPGKLKSYLLGKDVTYFPTEINVFYGGVLGSLKYKSFDDFRNLYKQVYGIPVNSFRPVLSSTWGANFRIAAVGIELGKIKAQYHAAADKPNTSGRQEFDLELNENNLAFFLGKRGKKSGMGINIGGSFGKATLIPQYNINGSIANSSPQDYLNGTFKTKYQTLTIGPEYYRGYGRLKLVLRYDWSLKPLFKDNIYPYGLPIKQDDIFDPSTYGPYIPRDYEGYSTPNSKAGAGDGRMYVGSDIRCNRFSFRLTYSIIYRKMPGTKPKPNTY